MPHKSAQSFAKRAIDVIASAAGLVLLSPAFAVIAACIWLNMGRPIFFRQRRPGLNQNPFEVLKFRSMAELRDADGNLLPDSVRLTPLGKMLREFSLDELPQLWNVLRGDMSLVGPRPLLMEYLPRYSAFQTRRHEVKPGITGWAQVHGRNEVPWERRFELDVWYVDHQNLGLDLDILFLTFANFLKRDGISQPGEATMSPFGGQQ